MDRESAPTRPRTLLIDLGTCGQLLCGVDTQCMGFSGCGTWFDHSCGLWHFAAVDLGVLLAHSQLL
jgi:hypothetical protein